VKKSVLIIGSEGATGKSIYELLSFKKSYNIYCLSRSEPANHFLGKKHLNGDLNDIEFCKYINKNYLFDYIIYAAGIWRGKKNNISYLNENLEPFKNFIKFIAGTSSHIIFFSSSAVYGKSEDAHELRILNTDQVDSTYGLAKLTSENLLIDYCHHHSKKFNILRPFHIVSKYEKYNPGRSHVVTDFVYDALKAPNIFDKKINDLPDIWVPFTWSDDIAKLIELLLNSNESANEIFNIGSHKTYSLKDLHKFITSLIIKKLYKSPSLTYREVNTFNKSYEYFGNYASTDFEDFIKIFIDYKINDAK